MGLFMPNIEKLEKSGDIDGLLKCLKHRNSDVKIEAFKALAKRISDKRIRDELRKVMDETDTEVVVTAVLTFFNLGEDVKFEKLYDIMNNATKRQKIEALKIIEEKCAPGTKEITSVLVKAITDTNLIVVKQAIVTIGKLKNSLTIGYLAQRLNEQSYTIRLLAVDALSSIGGDQVVDALIGGLLDSNHIVRNHATSALMKIGTEKALKALNDTTFLAIIKGMGDMETVRIETIEHIAKQKIVEALGLLHKACSDKYKGVRIEALKAVAVFASKDSLHSVIPMLSDKFYDVRLEAVKALGNIPCQESLDALEKVLDDKNFSVKHEAKIAYDSIKKKINA